jgi:hypothetical protein
MIAGLGITLLYIVRTHPFFGGGLKCLVWHSPDLLRCIRRADWFSGDRCRQPADATSERCGAGVGGQGSPPGCW